MLSISHVLIVLKRTRLSAICQKHITKSQGMVRAHSARNITLFWHQARINWCNYCKKRRIHLFFQYVTILSSEPEDLHIFHKHKIFDLIGPVPSRLDL